MSDESPVKLTNTQRELLMAAENDTIVWLTRTEYETLRYAARILATERPGHPAIAALRAAGILEGE